MTEKPKKNPAKKPIKRGVGQGVGGGRKEKTISDEQLDLVEKLAAILSTDQIADMLGMSRTRFYEIRKENEKVDERYKKGRAKAIAGVAGGLLKDAIDGDMTARIFYLKTQAGWKETSVVENIDAGELTRPDDLTDEELSKIVRD
mgnify:CR=1 FL=1